MRRLLFPFCLVLACSPPPPADEPPHFLWSADAQSLDNPFPDARLLVDGALTLRPKWYLPFLPPKARTAKAASYFNKLGQQAKAHVTALGNFGSTLVPASEAIDPNSVQGAVARLVREGAGWRVLERAVPLQHPRDVLALRGVPLPDGYPEFLATRPTIPLPEGQEGLVVVLRGPKTKRGPAFGRGHAWAATAPELGPIAAALGVSPDEVLLALPEKAGDITTPFRALAQWAETNPVAVTFPPHAVVADDNNGSRPVGLWRPSDSDWGQLGLWLDKRAFSRPSTSVGVVALGELAARDLREAGVFRADWVADPASAPVVPLRFVLTLPAGTKPSGGWPVVMGQHGVADRNTPRFGNTQSFCLEWAGALAARGMGCIGIDAPNHGSRGGFTSFFSIDDLPALRDRMREMTFDLLQVERAVVTIDVDADGVPDVAPKVRYFGNSMGAIMGSAFVPVSNRTTSALLNVPGAGLSNVVVSHFLQDLIGLLIVAQTDLAFDSPEYLASFPLFRAVAQPFFEPGDPINFAPAVNEDVAVLLQAGIGDLVIPMGTSADLAGALRLDELTATAGTAPVHAFVRADRSKYLPASQAADYNGHNVIWDFAPIREQGLTFLQSDGRVLLAP